MKPIHQITLADITRKQQRHDDWREVLDILCGEAESAEQIGKRTILFGRLHGVKCLQNKSQRDLAKFLGISEARVSARLKFLRDLIP